MCGIAGRFDPAARASAEALGHQVQAMCDTLAHRGPDAEGAGADPAAGIHLGTAGCRWWGSARRAASPWARPTGGG